MRLGYRYTVCQLMKCYGLTPCQSSSSQHTNGLEITAFASLLGLAGGLLEGKACRREGESQCCKSISV